MNQVQFLACCIFYLQQDESDTPKYVLAYERKGLPENNNKNPTLSNHKKTPDKKKSTKIMDKTRSPRGGSFSLEFFTAKPH